MKLIKLEIQGLNSFVNKSVIDFGPLFEKGLFGIFGATGSGKSSILDAIFLALYGKVLRTKTEKEFINTNTNSAKVKLSFDMRDSGVDKRFEVSRDYGILADDKLYKKAKLIIINGKEKIELASTDDEVTKKIIEIIGFGAEEFQRFIALPQGQFAQFLKDTPKDKIDTIAKLFNLDEFGDYFSNQLKEQKNENAKRKEYLRGVLEQYIDIDEKTIKNNEKKIAELNNISKEIAKVYTVSKKNLRETEKIVELTKEKKEVLQKIKELKVRQKKFNEDFYKLNVLKTTFALAPSYSKLNVLRQEVEELENKKESLSDEITATSNSYFQAISTNEENKTNLMIKLAECERRHSLLLAIRQDAERYYEIEKEKDALTKTLKTKKIELKKLENVYNGHSLSLDNSLKILQDLDEVIEQKPIAKDAVDATIQITTLKSQIEAYTSVLMALENELQGLKSKKQLLIDELVVSDEKLNKYRKQLFEASKSLKEFFEDEESADIAMAKATEELDVLKYQGTAYLENQLEIKLSKQKSTELANKIKEEKQILENVMQDSQSVNEKVLQNARDIKDLEILKEKTQNDNLISFLKSDLKIGESCPVCDKTIDVESQNTATKQLDEYLANISKKQEEAQRLTALKEDLFTTLTETNQNIALFSEQRNNLLNDIAFLNKKQKLIEEKNPEFISLTKEILENKILKQENIVLKLQSLIKALNKTKDSTYLKERVCVKTSSAIDELNKQEVLINEKLENYTALVETLKSKANQFEETQNTSLTQAQDFQIFNQQQTTILEQQKALVPDIVRFVNLKQDSSIEFFNAKATFSQDEIRLEHMIDEMKLIVKKLQDLNIKGFVKDEIATNLSNIETLKQELSGINSFEGDLLKTETKLKLEKAATVGQTIIKKAELDNATQEFLGQCILAGLTEDDLKNEVVYDDIVELEKNVSQYKTELEETKSALDRVENLLGGKEASEKDLTKLENEVKELEQKYVDTASNAMLIQKQTEKDKENVNKLTYFKMEYLEVIDKEKYYIELSKLNKNDAILKFITEEYILSITERANGYFAMLTNGRYQLLFDNDFIVVDNINGGATRSVGTLSGGETFLASLAIAISIVETLSILRDKPLDFVFLDEGFGTLDESSIEMVMTAIRNLQKTKLVFGLITHEELVKFKTQTRIEVYKIANEGSKVEVVF